MQKLFQIKMHDAIFDIEYAKIDMADRLYAYQIYCSVGNSGDLIAGDFETINELSSFVSKGHKFEAEADRTDDMVDTLILFSWMTTEGYFKDLCDKDTRQEIYE